MSQTATYTTKPLSDLTLLAVQAEALTTYLRQQALSCNNPYMPWLLKLAALGEKYGDVCRELNRAGVGDKDKLVKELLGLAACALMCVESLEGSKALIGQRSRIFLPGTDDPGDVQVVRNWHGVEYHRHRAIGGDIWRQPDDSYWKNWAGLFEGGALTEVRGEPERALVEDAELAAPSE